MFIFNLKVNSKKTIWPRHNLSASPFNTAVLCVCSIVRPIINWIVSAKVLRFVLGSIFTLIAYPTVPLHIFNAIIPSLWTQWMKQMVPRVFKKWTQFCSTRQIRHHMLFLAQCMSDTCMHWHWGSYVHELIMCVLRSVWGFCMQKL